MKLFAPLAALIVANDVTATTNSQQQQLLRSTKLSIQDAYQRSSHTNREGERLLQDTDITGIHQKSSQSQLPWENGTEEEVKTNISECIISVNQSQVDEFIDLAERVDASTMTFIPSAPATSNFVIGNENLTNTDALAVFEDGQPMLSKLESFQWFSLVLPTRYDENRVCSDTSDLTVNPFDPPQNISVCSLPPSDYPSPNGPDYETEMLTPFIHQSPNASMWGYQKFGSGLVTEACLAPYIGLDLDEIVSDSIHTSIFAMNHENRGSNNERKRQYMTALTCDKMQFYVPQIQDALNDTIETLRADPEIPLLSTWAHNLDILSLDLHLGKVDHPRYVIDYVKRLNNATSSLPTGCGDLESQENIKSALCEVEHVEAYFHERVQAIVADKDKSTFVFWWYQAGMCVEETDKGEVYMKCLTQEILHNIFAFALYVTATFLVITSKVVGRVVTENIFEGIEPLSDTKLDFFQLYADATDDDRLDIIRETWRQLLPNNAWVSSHQTSEASNMSCMVIIQAIQAVVWHHDIYMTGDEKDPGTNQLRDVLFGLLHHLKTRKGTKTMPELARIIGGHLKDQGKWVIKDNVKYCPLGTDYPEGKKDTDSVGLKKIIQTLKTISNSPCLCGNQCTAAVARRSRTDAAAVQQIMPPHRGQQFQPMPFYQPPPRVASASPPQNLSPDQLRIIHLEQLTSLQQQQNAELQHHLQQQVSFSSSSASSNAGTGSLPPDSVAVPNMNNTQSSNNSLDGNQFSLKKTLCFYYLLFTLIVRKCTKGLPIIVS